MPPNSRGRVARSIAEGLPSSCIKRFSKEAVKVKAIKASTETQNQHFENKNQRKYSNIAKQRVEKRQKQGQCQQDSEIG